MATAQSKEALAFADECRLRRAQLGRELKAGEVRLPDLLDKPTLPVWFEGETVARLLNRLPYFGKRRVDALLADLRISHLRRIGELTYRQRRQLSEEVAIEERTKRHSSSQRRARIHRAGLAFGAGPVGARRTAA